MTKVYLAVPIIANRDINKAATIAKIIENLNHTIVSKWVTKQDSGLTMEPIDVFKRDVKGIRECDVLVAETSDPSHGVGMEIMLAYLEGKKIICLLKKGAIISRMLLGLPNILIIEYTSERQIAIILKELLDDHKASK